MEKVKFPVMLTTVVLLAYSLMAAFNYPYQLVFWLFMLTNGLFIWMVIRILKDGKPSEKTFEEAFYEDVDYKRNTGSN